MQQVADAVIATGQEHTVYIFDNDEVLEENKYCTASLRDDGRVRMEFHAANYLWMNNNMLMKKYNTN